MASTESGIPSLSESRSCVAVRAPIVDVVALRLVRAWKLTRTGAAASGAPPASEAKPRGAPTTRPPPPGCARANEVRRGRKALLDVAMAAQARPPGEGQHVVAQADQAPARECAGDGDAEHESPSEPVHEVKAACRGP